MAEFEGFPDRVALQQAKAEQGERKRLILEHVVKLRNRMIDLVDRQDWYDDLLRQLGPWWSVDFNKWIKAMKKLNAVRSAIIQADAEVREFVQGALGRSA